MSARRREPVTVTLDATLARYSALASEAEAAGQPHIAEAWRIKMRERADALRAR